MGFLKKVWGWLDGRKTKIGAGLYFVGKIVGQLGHPEIGRVLETAGEAVGVAGAAHATVKAGGDSGGPQESQPQPEPAK